MRSMTFLVNDRTAGDRPSPAVAVTITENADGTLTFSIRQLGPVSGDLRGFFFDVANESLIGTLSVAPTAGLTEFRQGNDSVKDLGNGANMQGLLGSDGGYDGGVEIGKAGTGHGDNYESFSFTLRSSARALTLDDFANVDIGVRVNSVDGGWFCGDRDGESKLLETTGKAYDAKDDAGAVTEDAPVNQATGNVFGNDLNLKPAHLVTAVNGSASNIGDEIQGIYGTFRLQLDGSFTYTLDNSRAATQALAAGQVVIESFSYTAKSFDELTSYSTDSAVVRITITGAADNLAPVITAAVATGTVTEVADLAPGEGTVLHSATGTVDFADANLADTHTLVVAAAGGGYLGTFNAAITDPSTGDGAGRVTWTFELADGAIEHLAAGESLTQGYTLTLDDGQGGTVSQAVTITITGSNDAPVIAAGVEAGAVAELADNAPGEGVLVHSTSDSFNFSDLDLSDEHAVSVTAAGDDYLGELSAEVSDAATGDGSGEVTWSFEVSDGAIEHLGAGDSLTQTYTLAVDDGNGGTATQDVTVTITGENDAPEIVQADATGQVFEDGARRDSGQIVAQDVDQGDTLAWSVDGNGPDTPRADYRYLLDNLSIVRNGASFFNDDFGNGTPPPSAPAFTYFTSGSFLESGGRAIMDGGLGVPFTAPVPGAPTVIVHTATLATDNNSLDVTQGLKRAHDFRVEARYDLVLPEEELSTYTLRLTDSANDIVSLDVRRMEDGSLAVALREIDTAGTLPVVRAAIPLAPAAGDNQIVLRLEHAAGSDLITASFDLLSGGVLTHSETFATPVSIFSDESWTRAQVIGQAPAVPQNGTYGTLSVDADGEWHYSLNNGALNVQQLAQGEHASDTFTVTVADEHGAFDTETVTIDVVGSNDGPVIDNAQTITNGSVQEDINPVATGRVAASDVDHGAILKWTVGPTLPVPLSPPGVPGPVTFFNYRADYHFTLDQLRIERNGDVFVDDFDAGGPPPAAGGSLDGAPVGYLVPLGQYTESGGRLHLDGTLATAQRGIGNPNLTVGQLAVLATNNDPNDLTRGLKSDDDFKVEARYDLALPAAAGTVYGITLTDNSGNSLPQDQLGDSNMSLLVRRDAGGNLIVQLNDFDVVTDVGVTRQALALEPEAGENQIVLRLIHDKDEPGIIHAEFDLVGGADGPRTFYFTAVAHAFGAATEGYAGDDENWTRVQLVAFGPDLSNGTSLAGTYGTLSVQQNGQWTYSLDPVLSQSLAQGQFAQDLFAVRVTDEHGVSNSRPVIINVTGTNDAPATAGGVTTGSVTEDVSAFASGHVAFTDPDMFGSHAASAAASPGNTTALGTFSLGSVSGPVGPVGGSVAWSYQLDNTAAQYLAAGQTITEAYSVTVTDNFGASSPVPQEVKVTITGTNDGPVANADQVGGTGALRVAVIGTGNSPIADVAAQLDDSSGFSIEADAIALATYSTALQWSAALAGYDVVVVGSSGFFDAPQFNSSNLFPALRSFVDAGGGVVTTGWFTYDMNNMYNGGMPAAVDADYISPVARGSYNVAFPGEVIAALDPTHPIVQGIPSYVVGADYHEITPAIDPSATALARPLFNSQIAIAYDEVGDGLTAYLGGLYLANTAYNNGALRVGIPDQLFEQAVAWVGGGGGASTDEDHALTISAASLLANDTDVDLLDVLAIDSVSATSARGALVSIVGGNVLYDPTASAELQALNDGETRTDTFSYTVRDGHGGFDTATVTLTVAGLDDEQPNTPPVAVDDINLSAVVEAGIALQGIPFTSGNLLTNDIDPDVPAGLHVTEVNGMALTGPSISVEGIYGTLSVNPDGTWGYMLNDLDPDTNQLPNGELFSEEFTYTVADAANATDTGALTITIRGNNDAPVAVADAVGSAGTAFLGFSGSFNPSNHQGYAFEGFTLGDGGGGNAAIFTAWPAQSTIRHVLGGDFLLERFTVKAASGGGGTMTLRAYDDGVLVGDRMLSVAGLRTITQQADLQFPAYDVVYIAASSPSVVAILDDMLLSHDFGGISEDQSTAIDVLANDHDVDLGDTLTVNLISGVTSLGATLTVNPDGTVQYDPTTSAQLQALNQGQTLTDLFFYQVTDGHGGGSALANVTVLVRGANEVANTPPVITGGDTSGAVIEDTVRTASGTLNAADPDDATAPSWAVSTPGTYGSAFINATGNWTYHLNDLPATGGFVVQQLAQGQVLTDSFSVVATDEHGAPSAPQTVAVQITGTNDRPFFTSSPVNATVSEDALSITGLATAVDVDNGAVLNWSLSRGTTFGYSADYLFNMDRFSIEKNGSTIFDDGFDDGNPPPSAPNFSNGDPANYLTVSGQFGETNGELVLGGNATLGFTGVGFNGLLAGNNSILNTNIDPANLALGLKSNHDFLVEGIFDLALPDVLREGYGIQLSDSVNGAAGVGLLGDDQVSLIVRRDSVTGELQVQLLDSNTAADTTVITSVPLDAMGGDQIRLLMTHDEANPGVVVAAFEYLNGGAPTGVIVPVASASIFGGENWTRAGFLALGPDGFEHTSNLAGTYGNLSINGTGQWTYTPHDGADALAQGESQVDRFHVRATDQFGLSSSQPLNITVNGANDAPVAVGDADSVIEDVDTIATGNVLENDIDVDHGAVLSVTNFGTHILQYGTLTLGADGSYVYQLDHAKADSLGEGQIVHDVFDYFVTDGIAPIFANNELDITVTGTADAVVPTDGEVFEDGSRRDSGQLALEGTEQVVGVTGTGVGTLRADYRFFLDNLSITRGGLPTINDDFGNGAPPPSGPPSTPPALPLTYTTFGSFAEGNGRLVIDGSTGAVSTTPTPPGIAGVLVHTATLNTDATNFNPNEGIKKSQQFTVEARFDLVVPDEVLETYGVRLTDFADDTIEIGLRRVDSSTVAIVLRESDAPGVVLTTIGETPLLTAPIGGQIALRLTHSANADFVTASFDVYNGIGPAAPIVQSGGFFAAPDIFTGEDWTRAQVIAFGPATPQNGQYGTLSVEADGDWSYTRAPNSAPNIQALSQGERAIDTFNVAVSDGLVTTNETVTVAVVGTNDVPVVVSPQLNPPFTSAYAIQNGVHDTASGVAVASDPDHAAVLTWSVNTNAPFPAPIIPYRADYLIQLDELTIMKNGAPTPFFRDTFSDGISPTAPGGAPAGFGYLASGTFSESGDRAVLNGQVANSQRGVGIDGLVSGHLLTVGSNIDPGNLAAGLKIDDTFEATAIFDLATLLPGQGYGFSLSDNTTNALPPDQLGDDVISVEVANVGGNVVVRFIDRDVVADTIELLGSMDLTPLVAGNTQIALKLSHLANTGQVHASFDLIGTAPDHFDLGGTGYIFGKDTPTYAGDDENWTRVQVIALGPDLYAGTTSIHGQYGTLSIGANTGAWTYELDPTSSLPHGFATSDSFNLRVTDQFGVSSARPLNITVVGTEPTPIGPINFLGGSGNDIMVGSNQDDHFSGSPGTDLITGLDGADTFDYNFNGPNEGADTISDFRPGQGDKLDFHDLLLSLPGYMPGVTDAATLIFLEETNVPGSSVGTNIRVDTDGFAGGPTNAVAFLDGVTGLNVNEMIANGSLIV